VFFFLGCNLFFGKDIELAKGLKWRRYKRTTPISMMSSFSLPPNPLHL
jgi:hypothetical protein